MAAVNRIDVDRSTLAKELATLELPSGDLLLHVSMRKLGPPAGGPQTLLDALFDAATDLSMPAPTIVVPTQTTRNSTTSRVFRTATAGMDARQVAEHVARMPGFTVDMPSNDCGAFAEHVRTATGAFRSTHPQTSFAAVGPRAAELMAVHDLNSHLGPRSPLGRLYEDGAHALLIGCGWNSCTALHLAECLVGEPRTRTYRCFVEQAGRRRTYNFTGIDHDDHDFGVLGAALERAGVVWSGTLGRSEIIVVPIRQAVDFAVGWLTEHRQYIGDDGRSGRDGRDR